MAEDELFRPPTNDEFDHWFGAAHVFGIFPDLADSAVLDGLWSRLTTGLVVAIAGTMVLKRPGATPRELFVIPREWWEDNEGLRNVHAFLWRHGHASMRVSGSGSTRTSYTVELFDVRFEPNGFRAISQRPPKLAPRVAALVEALEAHSSATPTPADPEKPESNRGRKPWPHWEDVWAEMVARVMRGELSASKQADFERAMLEVAEQYPKAPNESTVRLRAQRVWIALRNKAENSHA